MPGFPGGRVHSNRSRRSLRLLRRNRHPPQ
jgi:hypothetical protein